MPLKVRSLTVLIAVLLFSSCRDEEQQVTPDTTVTIEGRRYPVAVIGTQNWTTTNYDGPGGAGYDVVNSKPQYGKYYSNAELPAIVLPAGWRIPTQEDYKKLAEFHGVTLPSHGTDTEKIKSIISETNWNNVSGTNASGFNAYPAGYIFGGAPPIDGDIAEFWTSEGVTVSIQEAGANLTSLRMVFYESGDSPDYKFNVRFMRGD